MSTKVRSCPKCFQLMWVKKSDIQYVDEDTIQYQCPHCKEKIRIKLVTHGSNAEGPKMGH